MTQLEALLRVGAWTEAESLMGRMPPYFAVSSQAKIAEALAQLVHVTMDPLHRKTLLSQSRVEWQNLKLKC